MSLNFDERILCAGHGGQGIMSMGKVLTYAGLTAGYNATWLPSYGAEVRGGTAYSMIRMNGGYIANPVVRIPGSCIIMNQPSLDKFAKKVKKGGVLLFDSSLNPDCIKRKDLTIKTAAFKDIALNLGNIKVANMVALGSFAKLKTFLSLKSLEEAVKVFFKNKQHLIDLNIEALKKGHCVKF